MKVGAILNSEVGTLRSAAARGLSWWFGQVEEMVPRSLRRPRTPRQLIVWQDGDLKVVSKRGSRQRSPKPGSHVALTVPAHLAYTRALKLPRMGAADLRRLIEIEAERLSPLPASETVVGVEARTESRVSGDTSVDVAVLPQRVVVRAIAAADEAQLVVTDFGLAAETGRAAKFDFMPALRERQLVSSRRSPATLWWSVTAFAFLLNLAVLIMRDQQSVSRLSSIAEQQAPAVVAARAIEMRTLESESTMRGVIAERSGHNAIAALGIASQDLADGAWVQRLAYDGRTARLTGYQRPGVDVMATFRRDARVTAARSNSNQFAASTPVGQPFDISVELRRVQ